MTEIKAQVVEFDLLPHPNADVLSIAKIRNKEWQCVVKTSDMVGKSIGIYIPIDALVPTSKPEFSFLADKSKSDGTARIKTIRLRQKISQGLLINAPEGSVVGDDFTEALGVTRWEPAIPAMLAGDMVREPGNFQKYTSIENYKNFPNVFTENDNVVITEKCHGSNARFGLINDGTNSLQYYVGTHKTARDKNGTNLYSKISQSLDIETKLRLIVDDYKPTIHFIIFGEIYGSGVQDLRYDCEVGEQKLRLFDVLIDHQYQPWVTVETIAKTIGIETVPVLYRGKYSVTKAMELREGKTTLGGAHIREGIVVKSDPEDYDPEIGRKIIKFISDEYLLRKNATDGH